MNTNISNDETAQSNPDKVKAACDIHELIPINDEQLEQQHGLVKITAYIRTEASKAAERKQLQREREATKGMKQLNIKAPSVNHEKIKEIAQAVIEGKNIEIKEPVTSHPIVTLPRWRQFLVRLLTRLLELLN